MMRDLSPNKCKECRFLGDYTQGAFIRNPHYCCELYWILERLEYRVDPNRLDEKCPLKTYDETLRRVLEMKEKQEKES